jgi:hypothetical protein
MIETSTYNSVVINSINQLDQEDLYEIGEALTLTVESMRKIAREPNASEGKVIVAKAIVRAIRKGNWEVLEALISRLLGADSQNQNYTETLPFLL